MEKTLHITGTTSEGHPYRVNVEYDRKGAVKKAHGTWTTTKIQGKKASNRSPNHFEILRKDNDQYTGVKLNGKRKKKTGESEQWLYLLPKKIAAGAFYRLMGAEMKQVELTNFAALST